MQAGCSPPPPQRGFGLTSSAPQQAHGLWHRQKPRQRQRKWHRRVFTGCLNCRKRHVKCDEETPSCANCKRLNKPCAYSFTVVPSSANTDPKPTAPIGRNGPDNDAVDAFGSGTIEECAAWDDLPSYQESCTQIVPTTYPGASIPPHLDSDQATLYYQHFLQNVSSLLIIFDTPSNSNNYRLLPRIIGDASSSLLKKAMEALGAMHMSRLPQMPNRPLHHRAAINGYASIVTSLRRAAVSGTAHSASLELLATSLLLCMFENMSAADSSWKVHLVGAGQTLQAMYTPGPTLAAEYGADALALRRFLVSLMSYLDIAASCATGEGPLIPGDYWETLGGGWQYNLGVPGLPTTRGVVYRAMAQLRSSWSRIMSIQREISHFAKLQRSRLDEHQRALIYGDLVCRIQNWHDSAPDIFLQLEGLNGIPDDATGEQVETLTATACVQSYALACTVYLDRVMTRRVGRAAVDNGIKAAVDKILILVLSFSTGVSQLGVLWPLLTAGIATFDRSQQGLCRTRLNSMECFGFKVR